MIGLVKKKCTQPSQCLAIKTGRMGLVPSGKIFSKKGNVYKIKRWERNKFFITDDLGFEHSFDHNGEFFTML
tara:strand:- start:814 stop:1029 length:216 start_codon:yes stop_codon:yes gene_type:complete